MMWIIWARETGNVATYGPARWAEDKEIRSAGLLAPDEVVFGRYDHDIYVMTDPSMCSAFLGLYRDPVAAPVTARCD